MPAVATAVVATAFVLDATFGEVPDRFHPVAWFGRLVEPLDRTWSHPVAAGVLAAFVLPLVVAIAAAGAVAVATTVHPLAGGLLSSLVVFVSTSRRMLTDTAAEIVQACETDPVGARRRLPSLVGRDPEPLSPSQIRSAAVESAAENLADGLVAPLLAFALLAPWSLPAAAGAAVWMKAVNTVDSMLGYQDKPVGWPGARLDDLAMWVPARVAAGLLAVASVDAGAVTRARRWVRAPPSPNSGWPMATLAAILDVRLEKPGVYVLFPDRELPTLEEARQGVRVVGLAGALAFVGAGVIAWS